MKRLRISASTSYSSKIVEERRLGGVQLDPGQQLGVDLLQVLLDFVVQELGVDEEQVDVVRQQVADNAARQAGLALHQRRGTSRCGLALDLLPKAQEVIDLPLAARLGQVVGHGANDPTARVGGHELGDHVTQPAPQLARFDLPGDADFGGERHVDEEPAGERDLGGDPWSLGTDGFLDDLDELGLTALQLVGDVGGLAPARPALSGRGGVGATPIRNGPRTAPPILITVPRVLVGVVGLAVLGVLVLFRFD